MLKPIFQIISLPEDSPDIYLQTKHETYLNRPPQLAELMYPEFYQWWRSTTPAEQKTASEAKSNHIIKCKSADDFEGYLRATSHLSEADASLAALLRECDLQVETGHDLLTLCRCLKSCDISATVVDTVVKYYRGEGVDLSDDSSAVLPLHSLALGVSIANSIDFDDAKLVDGLSTYHWLMGTIPRQELITILRPTARELSGRGTTGSGGQSLDTDSLAPLGMIPRSTTNRSTSSLFP